MSIIINIVDSSNDINNTKPENFKNMSYDKFINFATKNGFYELLERYSNSKADKRVSKAIKTYDKKNKKED